MHLPFFFVWIDTPTMAAAKHVFDAKMARLGAITPKSEWSTDLKRYQQTKRDTPCINWNRNMCMRTAANCKYPHRCYFCGNDHTAEKCPQASNRKKTFKNMFGTSTVSDILAVYRPIRAWDQVSFSTAKGIPNAKQIRQYLRNNRKYAREKRQKDTV